MKNLFEGFPDHILVTKRTSSVLFSCQDCSGREFSLIFKLNNFLFITLHFHFHFSIQFLFSRLRVREKLSLLFSAFCSFVCPCCLSVLLYVFVVCLFFCLSMQSVSSFVCLCCLPLLLYGHAVCLFFCLSLLSVFSFVCLCLSVLYYAYAGAIYYYQNYVNNLQAKRGNFHLHRTL